MNRESVTCALTAIHNVNKYATAPLKPRAPSTGSKQISTIWTTRSRLQDGVTCLTKWLVFTFYWRVSQWQFLVLRQDLVVFPVVGFCFVIGALLSRPSLLKATLRHLWSVTAWSSTSCKSSREVLMGELSSKEMNFVKAYVMIEWWKLNGNIDAIVR